MVMQAPGRTPVSGCICSEICSQKHHCSVVFHRRPAPASAGFLQAHAWLGGALPCVCCFCRKSATKSPMRRTSARRGPVSGNPLKWERTGNTSRLGSPNFFSGRAHAPSTMLRMVPSPAAQGRIQSEPARRATQRGSSPALRGRWRAKRAGGGSKPVLSRGERLEFGVGGEVVGQAEREAAPAQCLLAAAALQFGERQVEE